METKPTDKTDYYTHNIVITSDQEYSLYLYNSIGDDGITQEQFIHELLYVVEQAKANNSNTITLHINSEGGDVMHGYGMYSAIKKLINEGINLITINDGIVASMATALYMLGTVRKAHDYSIMMVHDPSFGGRNARNEKEREIIDLTKQSLIRMFGETSKLTLDQLSELMTEETWLSSEQMFDFGILTDMPAKSKIAASLRNHFNNKNYNTMDLKALAKLLDCNEEKITDRVNELLTQNQKLETANSKATETIEKLNEKLKDLNKERANELVNNYIDKGVFAKEEKETLVDMATDNIELFMSIVSKFKEPKVNLSDLLKKADSLNDDGRKDWTIRDWEKQDPKGLRAMKENDVDRYLDLYNKFYKTEK